MGARVVDYRVSTLIVLCKDCGNDVGLYPARHKCTPVDRPVMPPLPLEYTEASSTHSISSENSSPSINRWLSRKGKEIPQQPTESTEESIYFNNFAQNLPETNENSSATGKKLWGRVRQNDKWKELSKKNEKPNQNGKLWGKLLQATQTMAERNANGDDRGAESDEDDWEGETHVSRILREYYEKNRLPLPNWLFDEGSFSKQRNNTERQPVVQHSNPARTPSRRRLWEDNLERGPSVRERERMELRKQPPPLPESRQDDYYRRPSIREQQLERQPSTRERVFDRHLSIREQTYDRHSYNAKERYYEEERTARDHDKVNDYYQTPSPPSSLGRYPTSLRRAPDAGREGLRINNYF